MPSDGLYAKLAAAQAEIHDLGADKDVEVKGTTRDGKPFSYSYSYVTESALGQAWRQHAAPKGLAWIPTITSIQRDGNVTMVWMDFRIIDGTSGEIATSSWCAYGQDAAPDKALNKAQTTATRTFLAKTLLQGGGIDAEETHVPEQRREVKGEEGQPASSQEAARPAANSTQIELLAKLTEELRQLASDHARVKAWDKIDPASLSPSQADGAIRKTQEAIREIKEQFPELPPGPGIQPLKDTADVPF